MPLDFDAETLPWVDRESFPRELEARLAGGSLSASDAELLTAWRRDGFVCLRGVVEHVLIDALLEDYERAWETRPAIEAEVHGKGVQPFAEVAPRSELTHHLYRLMDIQDVSRSAREVMLHPDILRFLRLVFDDVPVAMQSLFFEYGSQQGGHQDFPYVQARILSHLIGCWVACEDVVPDSGPLFYYVGSHRIPKFDWGGGELRLGGGDPKKVEAFQDFVRERCEEAGLERRVFCAGKGDALLWHAALVHGGSPAMDPALTRRSLVAHYSTATGYPRDRRSPDLEPRKFELNGGMIYLRQAPPGEPSPSLVRRLRSAAGRVKRKLLGGSP